MSDNKLSNEELFWLEQIDESNTKLYIPLDTPEHSPHIIRLKKRAIKSKIPYILNNIIHKQVSELKVFQKEFGSLINYNSIPIDKRKKGTVYELVSGSKFVDKKKDEIRILLEQLKIKEDNNNNKTDIDNDNQHKRNDLIQQKLDSIENECNHMEEEAMTYQNETLKTYNSLIDTYRSKHQNQLREIQMLFDNQFLKANDKLTTITERKK
ncbi:unnamed protein product [Cunninghamella blakesleeana]